MTERRARLALAWLALVLLGVASLAWRLPGYVFDTSLLALLPDHARDQWYDARLAADRHLNGLGNNRFVLAVGAADADQSLRLAGDLRRQLASDQWHYLEPAQQADRLWSSYWPHRYGLLADADRQLLQTDPAQLLSQARARLYAPLGDGRYDAINDPLFLFSNYLQEKIGASALSLQQGLPTRSHRGLTWRLLQFELQADAFSQALASDLPARVEAFRAQLPAGAELLQSGMIFHAAHGARQARGEITVIGTGSLVGVLVLLWLAFGTASLRLLAALLAGLSMALVVSLWSFAQLHLITLAFGASLIGVAIDYGIHARNAQQHGVRLAQLWRPLALGLLTSLLAYGLQATVAMPGLTQMALFSCVGLAASWLSVLLWLPDGADSRPPSRWLRPLFALADVWSQRGQAMGFAPGLGLAALLLVSASLLWLPGRDQVSALQTSTDAQLAQEQSLLALTGAPRPGRYLLVQAETVAALDRQVLQLEQDLQAQGVTVASYRAWLPGLAQQQADYQLLQTFYRTHLPTWVAQLNAPALLPQALSALTFAPLTLPALNQDAQALFWQPAPLQAFVYPDQVLAADQLAQLAEGRWTYVDRVGELSQVLAQHRRALLAWLVAAVAALSALLWWRLGPEGVLLLAAPLLAGAAALWLIALLDGGVNLFHCLALLLVLGVGFDSGVFFARADPREAWRGASLSIVTSLLAFGLLAMCQTPVLKSFGLVAAIGLSLCWLLVPLLVRPMLIEEDK